MATYYDGLKDFFEKNDFSPLASSAQLVYLHLLQLNNRHGNSGFVQISDRELERLTSLNKNTITKAKRTLKNCKWIDFYTEPDKPHRGTSYTLTFFRLGQSVGQTIGQSIIQTMGQSVGQSVGQPSEIPIIRAHEDLKTKDLKNEKLSTTTIARACAHVNKETELDKLVDYWEESRFGRLSIELISKLEVYLKKYGYSEVRAAMDSAKESNGSPYGVSFKYFATILENRQKGGDKSGRSDSIAPSPKPERDKLADPKPWDKYAPAL